MMIEKLNITNPIASVQKTVKNADAYETKRQDSVTLSSDAEKLAEVHFAMNAVRATSDVRAEKVAEMKAKFADPSYMDSVLEKVADVLSDVYMM